MRNILIVEDDPIVLFIYKGKFQSAGFSVSVAMDGDKAVETLKSQAFDIVLLDLMLPKKTGIEILKIIRADASLANLPVIVFTNAYFPEMIRQAIKAGANECLLKAEHTPKSVIKIIQDYLSNAQKLAQKSPESISDTNYYETSSSIVKDTFLEANRQEFLFTVPHALNAIRTHLKEIPKNQNSSEQTQRFEELFLQVRSLTSQAASVGFAQLAQFSTALEALITTILESSEYLTASVIRTLAQTVDFLGFLLNHISTLQTMDFSKFTLIAVDDDPINLHLIAESLRILKIKPILLDDPIQAQEHLSKTKFDLLLFDISMPDIDGLQLCKDVRSHSGPNHKTPIIFITGADNFESRIQSRLSGGNEFIVKPFIPAELNAKILISVLHYRLAPEINSSSA